MRKRILFLLTWVGISVFASPGEETRRIPSLSDVICPADIAAAADEALQYASATFDSVTVKQLGDLVRLESISREGAPPESLRPHAEAVAAMLKAEGMENVDVLHLSAGETESGKPSLPFVYADWMHAGPDAPTVLLYAHYDVKPAEGEERAQWKSEPFEPTLRDGRLYGRGSTDNKSGIAAYLATIRAFRRTEGKLPVNVRIVFEGEEELGSLNMERFLTLHPGKTRADVIFIADAGNFTIGTPGLGVAARGYLAVEVKLSAASKGGHSGVYGGAVPNPQAELARMVGTLHDETGRLAIEGIFDEVREPSEAELALLDPFYPSIEAYRAETGLFPGVSFHTQGRDLHPFALPALYPSVSVGSIVASGGETGQIPAYSKVALAFRTVADMSSERAFAAIKRHFEAQNRWGLELEVTRGHAARWWRQDMSDPVLQSASALFAHAYRSRTQLFLDGGTIPLLALLQERYPTAPVIFYGAWDPTSEIHAANESVHLETLLRTVESTILMWRLLGGMEPPAGPQAGPSAP